MDLPGRCDVVSIRAKTIAQDLAIHRGIPGSAHKFNFKTTDPHPFSLLIQGITQNMKQYDCEVKIFILKCTKYDKKFPKLNLKK